jgi:DNA invertase Pin-like site-specific DNA recombinase
MSKVISFVRVSTLKQKTSIKNQISRIKEYCKQNELHLVEMIKEEGVSGRKIHRKGFVRMLDMVENKEIDGIICLNLSRIGRRASMTLELINTCLDNDVFIYDIKDGTDTRTPGGRMAVKMRAVMYEEELIGIRENIREVISYKKTNGMKYNGRMAYGVYEKKGILYEDEFEMKIVRNVKNLRSRGWSWYKICKNLNENGIPTKENGDSGWNINQVRRVIQFHYENKNGPLLVK